MNKEFIDYQIGFQEAKINDEEMKEIHNKLLKIMCPSKDAPLTEQMGYYNYFCQYFHTEEEEHKIDSWTRVVETVYWNLTKRLVLSEQTLLNVN